MLDPKHRFPLQLAARLIAYGSLATLFAAGCGGSTADPDAQTAGIGGVGGNAGSGSGGSAAGGSGGSAAGGSTATLDCNLSWETTVGQIEGHELQGHASTTATQRSEYWYLDGRIDDYDVSIWPSQGPGSKAALAHLSSLLTGEHICVANAAWNGDFSDFDTLASSITLSGFSSIGTCMGAAGPTYTLRYCNLAPWYHGTPPEGCTIDSTRIWGEVNGVTIDENRRLHHRSPSAPPGPTESIDVYVADGGRLNSGYVDETGKLTNGFLQLPMDGVVKVYCVHGFTDEAPNDDDADLLKIEVSELGSCPGKALGGEVEACF